MTIVMFHNKEPRRGEINPPGFTIYECIQRLQIIYSETNGIPPVTGFFAVIVKKL